MKQGHLSIGVDVSKKHLDVFIPQWGNAPKPQRYRTNNGRTGFRRIAGDARKSGARVCLEPTGGYERGLVEHLQSLGIPVVMTPGRSVRLFAESMGRLSKNDTIDAESISNFADTKNPDPLPPPDSALVELRDMVRAAASYTEECARFRNLLETQTNAKVRRDILATIRHLENRVEAQKKRARKIIGDSEKLQTLFERYQSVKGVGEVTAMTLLAEMPELGSVTDARAAALAGLVPRQNQSGGLDHRRRIGGGRKVVRNALYMAAFNACRCNPVLKQYYDAKKEKSPGFKWTIVPVMRKLLHVLNRIAHDPDWQPK